MTRLQYHLIGRGPQYVVAARCNIHPTTLREYSRGIRPIPPHHLINLSEALGVPPADLIGEVDQTWLESFQVG